MLRNRQLADIVKHGGGAQRVHFLFREPEFPPDPECVHLHTLQVIVCFLIARVDRHSQGLDGTQMQAVHLFDMLFLLHYLRKVCGVRAMNDIHHRQADDRQLPLNAVRHGSDDPGNRSPTEVIR
jgi:hypothetical protein